MCRGKATRPTRSFPRAATPSGRRFPENTDYWPPAKQAMVNYAVGDLDAMLAQLRDGGVEVDERIEVLGGIGRFGRGVDPEGNRFELWEPLGQ